MATGEPKPRVGLMRSTLAFSGMTQISRVMGMARDMIFAQVFSVGGATDAFFVAFKIPNFLRRLFAEGAFSQAFVPIFSEYKQHKSFHELQNLIARTSGSLSLVLLAITALGILCAPWLMYVFGYGFVRQYPQTYDLATQLLRITFPYLLFISLTAMAASVLNSFGKFAIPALTPVLLNFSLIAAALWASPHFEEPVTALAWGVLLAGVAQLLFVLPFVWRLKLLRLPRLGFAHEGVRRIIKLMLPALFGSAVVQVNLLLDTLIASLLVAGSVSWLYYADRLVEFPLGVFGVAVGTVILPALSSEHAKQDRKAFTATVDWALRLVVVVALPAMTGLMVLAQPMLATLFQYGAFTSHDSHMASFSLMAYALGLPAFILIKSLTPAFYARQNTKTPVKIGLWAMAANMLLNIILVAPMVYFDVLAPHAGLALATAGSAWLQVWWLFRALHRQDIYRPHLEWARLWLKAFVGCALMAAVIFYVCPTDFGVLSFGARAGYLAVLIVLGAVVYLLAMLALGVRIKSLIAKHERLT